MAQAGINGYGEITMYIYRVGLWFLGSALPLIAIYLIIYIPIVF